jgi:hypothetical protein
MDRPRLEGSHKFGREAFQLLVAALPGQQQREIERDQRRVVVHPVGLELSLNLPIRGLGLLQPAQAQSDVSLRPTEADAVQRLSALAQPSPVPLRERHCSASRKAASAP